MLNHIWLWMIVGSLFIATAKDVYHEITLPENVQTTERNLSKETSLGKVTEAAIKAAGTGVEIAIGLIGVMALWLGIMKIAEASGMVKIIARAVKPVTRRLFPTIPEDHPSISAMIMNIAANMLGLGNAATPLGLKAMEELQKLNKTKDTASNDMITFLVINTSAITLIPASAIAIRASLGSANPQQIIIPAIIGATVATIVGLITVKTVQYIQSKKDNLAGGE